MTTEEFEDQLRRDGYLEIKHRCIERAADTPAHRHDFDTPRRRATEFIRQAGWVLCESGDSLGG